MSQRNLFFLRCRCICQTIFFYLCQTQYRVMGASRNAANRSSHNSWRGLPSKQGPEFSVQAAVSLAERNNGAFRLDGGLIPTSIAASSTETALGTRAGAHGLQSPDLSSPPLRSCDVLDGLSGLVNATSCAVTAAQQRAGPSLPSAPCPLCNARGGSAQVRPCPLLRI